MNRSHCAQAVLLLSLAVGLAGCFRPSFSDVTGANVGTLLAIVIDGRVVSAPRINSRIEKHGLIEGGFTREQALDLAIMLQAGPLPARLTVVEERVVGPGGA